MGLASPRAVVAAALRGVFKPDSVVFGKGDGVLVVRIRGARLRVIVEELQP